MTIAAWPVADWRRVVAAYKPGRDPDADGPLRTLKKHKWASEGVRVDRRARGRLGGHLNVYSALNLDAARLARHGRPEAAVRVARTATLLEAGPEFTRLQRALSELPGDQAQQVLNGMLPEGASAALVAAVRAVARRTEQLRGSQLDAAAAEVVLGRIAEIHAKYVMLAIQAGPGTTAVPRWMAVAAGRDTVGAALALVTDKLAGSSAVVEAVPAIDVDEDVEARPFTPFGRGDARALVITAQDELLLAREPQPLRVLVPVTIDE